jgi:translation initiation factor 2 subunit 1
MVKKKAKFPEIDELVIAQVTTIEKAYIYVKLDDYEGLPEDQGQARGMVHISELANRWIRNITAFVKPNQRVVLRVLRINPEKGQIDLSLRRVTTEQKMLKLNQWKFDVKAENLMRIFSQKTNKPVEELYDKIGFPLVEKYGTFHEAFEIIKEMGRSELDFLNLPTDWQDDFFHLVDVNVQMHSVDIDGQFEIVVYDGNGIEVIKDALHAASIIETGPFETISFHYIGAPRYNVKITANEYPEAEVLLKKVIDTIQSTIKPHNGHMEFIRTDRRQEAKIAE